jgi:2-dehydro-3-deoxygalactonokinase
VSAARLVALDWGTSSLRAFLLGADGRVLAQRQQPWGIQHLPTGGFDAALNDIAGDWLAAAGPVPLLACGMVGSAQGWHVAPYVPCPADLATLAAALVAFDIGQGRVLHIVPGLSHQRPDVMRGEETQVIGALIQAPRLAEHATLVMPGTHSKWVAVRDGRIGDFSTYLSGELFAVLRDHSILGRPQREVTPTAQADEDSPAALRAFDLAVNAVRRQGSATPLLFSTRALVLSGRLRAEHSMAYLSGLLIGDELRCGLSGRVDNAPLVLIGDAALCLRYRRALGAWADVAEPLHLSNTAVAGLWRLALQAGLVQGAGGADDDDSR